MNHLTKSRYFELVNKAKMLKTQGFSLRQINELEYSELSKYEIILESQYFYENRLEYINLIKNYIGGKIYCYEFQWDFFNLYHKHLEISENLTKNLTQSSEITFSTDPKIEKIALLIEDLVGISEFLGDGITPERFDLEIKKIYSEMQKYAPSTSLTANLYGSYNALTRLWISLTAFFYTYILFYIIKVIFTNV